MRTWRITIFWRDWGFPTLHETRIIVKADDDNRARSQARLEWLDQTATKRVWAYSTCEEVHEEQGTLL